MPTHTNLSSSNEKPTPESPSLLLLDQTLKDLAGLEKLHSMQLTLIRSVQKQLRTLAENLQHDQG